MDIHHVENEIKSELRLPEYLSAVYLSNVKQGSECKLIWNPQWHDLYLPTGRAACMNTVLPYTAEHMNSYV